MEQTIFLELEKPRVENNIMMDIDCANPLQFDHVMNNILRHLGKEDIKNCRLVNKQWNKISTVIMQQLEHPVHFYENTFNGGKLIKLLRVLKKSENPPFTKFEISAGFCVNKNEGILLELFNCCRMFVECLTVNFNRKKVGDMGFTLRYLSKIQFPKLKHLHFNDETKERENDGDFRRQINRDVQCQNFFRFLLAASPQLERLDMSFPSKYLEMGLDDNPFLPESLMLVDPPLTLNHLDFSARISNDQLIALTNSMSHLRMKSLHFRLKNSILKQSSFKALLQSHSESLEQFQIIEDWIGSQYRVEFPRMKKLSVFTLFSTSEQITNIVTFTHFGYEEQLPHLKKLVLWNAFGTEERWRPFFMPTSPSHSLQTLELPNHFRSTEMAERFSETFPCLRKLKVGFSLRPEDVSVLQIIFKTMETLEELDIRTDMDDRNQNIDSILTGIPLDDCRHLRNNCRNYAELDLHSLKIQPGLSDLTRLNRLHIILDNSRPPLITDLTGYMGFLKMHSLKHLQFTQCGISSKCLQQLESNFHVRLIPSSGQNFYEFEHINFNFD